MKNIRFQEEFFFHFWTVSKETVKEKWKGIGWNLRISGVWTQNSNFLLSWVYFPISCKTYDLAFMRKILILYHGQFCAKKLFISNECATSWKNWFRIFTKLIQNFVQKKSFHAKTRNCHFVEILYDSKGADT